MTTQNEAIGIKNLEFITQFSHVGLYSIKETPKKYCLGLELWHHKSQSTIKSILACVLTYFNVLYGSNWRLSSLKTTLVC